MKPVLEMPIEKEKKNFVDKEKTRFNISCFDVEGLVDIVF
jgi:hypothetical protein